MYCCFFFFFFQAEDGIRDYKVTGVQTCALPISFDSTLVIAAVSVVFPWSMCPIVPTFMCGLDRSNFSLAIATLSTPSLTSCTHTRSNHVSKAHPAAPLLGRVVSALLQLRRKPYRASAPEMTTQECTCCHPKFLEPMSGIEPLTPSLPRTCSTN